MRWWLIVAAAVGVSLLGCPTSNERPDAFMRDAGPPDPDASTNCRAVAILPRGTYWMGSDERPGSAMWPAHQVTLTRDGWVTRFESTNACYRVCVDAGGCDGAAYLLRDPARSRLPALALERADAEAYCRWLGGRLLTEAEWEAMARGPEGRAWPWCEAPSDPRRPTDCGMECEMANWNLNGSCMPMGPDPSPVGANPGARGPFGHEDVVGNASEWVLGAFLFPYPSEPQTDPLPTGDGLPIGRFAPIQRASSGDTARCLFTSPPEPLYVEE